MKRCPITYEPLAADRRGRYSLRGLRQLARGLTDLADLEWSAEQQRREAATRATKMSIQGVQPKLSARLAVKAGRFEVVDKGGRYILKPQTVMYANVPENEALTMRLAGLSGIRVPVHGLVHSVDGSWTYFVQRFDRLGRGHKRAVEDFAQLSGRTRDTKYDSSMEQVVETLEKFCTFPAVEKVELFRRTLFCFLTGNEDMHLKNFSLIIDDGIVKLSPAYDLVNTTITLSRAREEFALPLRGKKRRLTRRDLMLYFGRDRLGLAEAMLEDTTASLTSALGGWQSEIDSSFLPASAREDYAALVQARRERLGF
jgi:serine/threonine-protein kinase HipA